MAVGDRAGRVDVVVLGILTWACRGVDGTIRGLSELATVAVELVGVDAVPLDILTRARCGADEMMGGVLAT